jgi:glutamine synthetase
MAEAVKGRSAAAPEDGRADPGHAAERAGALIAEHGISTVELCFTDLWGGLCGRRVPASRLLDLAGTGVSWPNAPFAWSISGEIVPVAYTNPDTGYPNMLAVPDLGSLRPLGWRPGTAICFCDAHVDASGAPMPIAPVSVLRRATDRLAAQGLTATTAVELEFYLCGPDWSPIFGETPSWAMAANPEAEPFLEDLRSSLEATGVRVESAQAEYGPGQFEVNIGPSAPVRSAEDAVLLKYVAKELARRHGMRATFMPSPFTGATCCGLHVHQSLAGEPAGERAFAAGFEGGAGGAYLAGQLDRLVGLTAVLSPSVNAYKRASDYTFAANRVTWGVDNRSTAVRAVGAGTPNARIELRTPSSDANPFLAVAAAVAAGADGVARGLEPPPPTAGDAYADGSAARLPGSLAAAIAAFRESAFSRELFGPELVDAFGILIDRELAAFAAHVTDWERGRYLELS